MHVLSITIQEIANQLLSAKPDPALWQGDAARAYAANVDALVHDMLLLGQQLQANS
jgi:hypothetical protein